MPIKGRKDHQLNWNETHPYMDKLHKFNSFSHSSEAALTLAAVFLGLTIQKVHHNSGPGFDPLLLCRNPFCCSFITSSVESGAPSLSSSLELCCSLR